MARLIAIGAANQPLIPLRHGSWRDTVDRCAVSTSPTAMNGMRSPPRDTCSSACGALVFARSSRSGRTASTAAGNARVGGTGKATSEPPQLQRSVVSRG